MAAEEPELSMNKALLFVFEKDPGVWVVAFVGPPYDQFFLNKQTFSDPDSAMTLAISRQEMARNSPHPYEADVLLADPREPPSDEMRARYPALTWDDRERAE